jgi:hypothetical protein
VVVVLGCLDEAEEALVILEGLDPAVADVAAGLLLTLLPRVGPEPCLVRRDVAQNAEFLVAGGFEDIEQTEGVGPPGQRAFNDEVLLPSGGNSDDIVRQEWLFDQRIPRPRSAAVCRLARCS